jgi:hypothetical protein
LKKEVISVEDFVKTCQKLMRRKTAKLDSALRMKVIVGGYSDLAFQDFGGHSIILRAIDLARPSAED